MGERVVAERVGEVGAEVPGAGPRRWQVGLTDLIVWVLTAGVAIGVVRGARVFGIPTPWRQQRLVGAVLEALAIVLVLPLVRPAVRWARGGGRPGAGGARALGWSIAWRVVALALLAGFVAEESWLLRVDHERLAELSAQWNLPRYRKEVLALDLNLYPVCAALVLIGLVAGMGTAPLGPPGRAGRSRLWWLGVVLAAVAGVLLMARTDANVTSLIAYLVVIAIEAVANAMRHHSLDRPGLSDRLILAGIRAALAGAAGLVTALWVAYDFRTLLAGGARPISWRQMRLRLCSLAVAVAAGAYLLGVALPAVHEELAAGVWMALGGRELMAIVAGFGILSFGLAARAVTIGAVPPAGRGGRLRARALGALRPLALSLALLSLLPYLRTALMNLAAADDLGGWNRLLDALAATEIWVLAHMPLASVVWPYLDPERLLWEVALIWLAAQVALLIAVPDATRPAPFDALPASRAAVAWALWLTAALTAVCLVAMPAFSLAGLALFHCRLNAADLLGGRF